LPPEENFVIVAAMAAPSPTAETPGGSFPGGGRDHRFHPLRVARVVHETPDASSFVLEVPDELHDTFAYEAGQFCTFRVTVDGVAHHRCYSMSSAPAVDDELQVTVKRVPGGVVSNWMNDALDAGDAIDVAPPGGLFCLAEGDGDVVALGAGSGITPVFSIVKAALATTRRPVRLLYANRDHESVIFREAIDALLGRYPDRLTVVHHLDTDAGFLRPDAVAGLVDGTTSPEVFVCGPGPFMDLVERALIDHGVTASRIRIERFSSEDLPGPTGPVLDEEPGTVRVTIELDGRTDTADHQPGATVLQTARQLGMSPPFSCQMGNCATCIAKLVDGEVMMHANTVLTDDEVADGWVLTCQSVPTTPSVRVVYGLEES
jgi:3-ketosteroid 9alpha-monooxygenase subunit B